MTTIPKTTSLIFGLALVFSVSAFAQTVTPVKKKVNFVAIGYDIQNNPKAQTMLQQMADAVRKGGGKATVLTAGANQAQLDQALTAAIDSATGKGETEGPSLVLKTKTFKPGDRLRVEIRNPPSGKFAWIGFYSKDANDRNYFEYILLKGIDKNIYEDVLAPEQPGLYNFRLFKNEGYDCVAVSSDLTIEP